MQKTQNPFGNNNSKLFNLNFKEYLFSSHLEDVYSGYRNPNFEKFTEITINVL
jgi:hypothetical protein